MLFAKNPRKLLSEAAAADLLDPKVSDEVKEVIDDLEDILTNNIEEVKDSDKTTNGGVPVVSEAVSMLRASNDYNGARYLVTLESVMAVMETEGEETAKELAEPGEAPTPEEVEANEPHAGNVVEDIAERNGVDPKQVAVVISAESFKFLAETALLEARVGKCVGDSCSAKKLNRMKRTVDELNAAGVTMAVAKKKGCK